MGAILSLSHFSIYHFFNNSPFSALQNLQSNMYVGRKLTCGVGGANLPPSTLQNTTFIACGKLPRGVILKIYPPPPSNLQNHAVDSIWRRLTCSVIAIGLSSGPLQNTLFDIWTNLASWVMFEMSFPSPTTKQEVERTKLEPRVMFGIYAYWTIHSNTFNIWIKLTCWFILLDLPALSPTKYEPAWHLDLCQNVPCLPLQQDNTLNTILSHFWNLQSLGPTKQYV